MAGLWQRLRMGRVPFRRSHAGEQRIRSSGYDPTAVRQIHPVGRFVPLCRVQAMRYRVNWTEVVGYYAYIEANTREEALELFHGGPDNFTGASEADGFCEMQDDAEVTEDPETDLTDPNA